MINGILSPKQIKPGDKRVHLFIYGTKILNSHRNIKAHGNLIVRCAEGNKYLSIFCFSISQTTQVHDGAHQRAPGFLGLFLREEEEIGIMESKGRLIQGRNKRE